MDATELRLAQTWRQEEDLPGAEIARRLGRSTSAVWRFLGEDPGARAGPPGPSVVEGFSDREGWPLL